ncbi:MAG TPA: DoxX family protein [bacterium]|jgi:hypothetical protein|nr:DoxX family protein [bacterium]HXC64404.1 DoxX family protein [bacterium]
MPQSSPIQRWSGRVLSGLVTLFLVFDAYMKITMPQAVIDNTIKMGFQAKDLQPIGVILLLCLVLYWIPALAGWGALVLTGFLGGAVCANLRMESPLFSFTLAPVYVAVLLWAGLLLRQPRYRAFFFPG